VNCCKREGYGFDIAYTSVLKRAIRTLWLALDALDLMWLPVVHSWRPERAHYGSCRPEQGGNGGEVRRAAGAHLAPRLCDRARSAGPRRYALGGNDPRTAI